MHLSELKIKGYKTFEDEFKIKFNQGLTILVGENGSGKTTVIDAIRLLLNEDEYGRIGVSKGDFHRSFEKSAKDLGSKAIEIQSIFRTLDDKEQIAFLPWLNVLENGSAILNLKIDNKENPRGKYNRIVWGGESISGIFEWELLDAIACIYLPPLRDAVNKLEAFRGSRLSRLFKNEKPRPGAEHTLEKEVREFNSTLLNNDSIKNANAQIKGYLQKSLGSFLGQDASIQFSETSFDRIVEKLRLLFYPKIGNNAPDLFREISENSLGYNNILYLATVLAELERSKECLFKVLLIEEPEAHLHPQLQIRLMQYLQEQASIDNIQIIVSTHSATITASANLDNLNILTCQEGQKSKSTLIRDCKIEEDSKFFLERWLDITKSTLFFAKGLIFVEGIAEALVLKELAKRIITEAYKNDENPISTLEDSGVSIINLNGIYFKHFLQIFKGYKIEEGVKVDADYIPIRCSCITDCDPKCFNGGECKPTSTIKCDCDNPQYYLIDELNSHSNNCRMFSNLKTFEYDLGLTGDNLKVMLEIFDEWLDTEGAIKNEIKELLKKNWGTESEESKSETAFNLLNRIESTKNKSKQYLGKGEFAQRLAKKLYENPSLTFTSPIYIENAILWSINKAKPHDQP